MADQQINLIVPGMEAPKIIPPFHAAPMAPEELAAKYSATTTMFFPKAVHLTLATNVSVYYPEGVHEVPDHLVNHFYLKAHDARPHYKQVAVPQSVGKGKKSAK